MLELDNVCEAPAVDEPEVDEEIYLYYVNKNSRTLYEVKLFETFALVKPILPGSYGAISKLSITDFADHFEEYAGDSEELRWFLGSTEEVIQIN